MQPPSRDSMYRNIFIMALGHVSAKPRQRWAPMVRPGVMAANGAYFGPNWPCGLILI
jgi:hypothetical protein